MATFSALAPIVAYSIPELNPQDGVWIVYAICTGSILAILLNDSFYWQIKVNAFGDNKSEIKVIKRPARDSIMLGFTAISTLLLLYFKFKTSLNIGMN